MTKTIRLAQPGDDIIYTTNEGRWGMGIVSEKDCEPEFFVVKVSEGVPEHDGDHIFNFPHTIIWTAVGDEYTVITG